MTEFYDVTVGDNGDVDGGEEVQNIILHANKLALQWLTYGAKKKKKNKSHSICLDSFLNRI